MDDDYDYWTEYLQIPSAAPQPALTVETIEEVDPLDDQFGVAAPLTVPVALQGAMFSQPAPTEAEVATHGGDPARVPPLHTYAILDAAKVRNLPEMLETSSLPHRCLFKGDAYDELKGVAPWIVQLQDGNAFTRKLFTRSNAPWHLWDHEPGIYVRSRSTLDEVWKHFRKFTKITGPDGRRVYFRFWEAKVMARYSYQHSREATWHLAGFVTDSHCIYLDLYRKSVVVVKGLGLTPLATPWPMLKDDLAQIRLVLFCEDCWQVLLSVWLQRPLPGTPIWFTTWMLV